MAFATFSLQINSKNVYPFVCCNFRVQELSGQCKSVVKEKKSSTVELQSGVEHFRCNANKALTALLGKNTCLFQSYVPIILTHETRRTESF